MKEARLQLRIDEDLKQKVEAIAQKKETSVSALVTHFFEVLVEQDERVTSDEDGVRQI